jgi:hypothetical protein
MVSYMPEFALPLTTRDRGWNEMRERLARAAREMHFYAFSGGAANCAALLVISGNFAGLAMSIPLDPSNIGAIGLVDSSTLFATQILQLDHRAQDNSSVVDTD